MSMISSYEDQPLAVPGEGERLHLPFIDGIRGVAALYVVLHHFLAWSAVGVSRGWSLAVAWTRFGHFMVNIFIVLSGFSLMLPVVLSSDGTLRGGIGSYLQRRARRILPPYFAALILSVGVFIGVTLWAGESEAGILCSPEISPGNLLTHCLLLHNLNSEWSGSINMALWSIATEWQIYFFFPFVLLPFWRLSRVLCAAASVSIGLAPHFVLPKTYNLDWSCPWYIALFTMGMFAASFSTKASPYLDRIRWKTGMCLSMIIYIVFQQVLIGIEWAWARDLCAGLFTMCLLSWCATFYLDKEASPNLFIKALRSKSLLTLGAFSYSLYLTHCAVLRVFWGVAEQHNLTPNTALLIRGLFGVPIALLFACGFYRFFEKPWSVKKDRAGSQIRRVKSVSASERA